MSEYSAGVSLLLLSVCRAHVHAADTTSRRNISSFSFISVSAKFLADSRPAWPVRSQGWL